MIPLSLNTAPIAVVWIVIWVASITQYPVYCQTEAFLSVEGEVTYPRKVTFEMLSAMTSVEVAVANREGDIDTYTGVPIATILEASGTSLGPELRGGNLTKFLLVVALDGYEAIFSLPEIDPEFTDKISILAYRLNGQPLPAGMGPFRLVIPHEKRQARWVREVKAFRINYAVQ
nr:molybdopterin-dependent oxidoreductase [Cytophagales bacterium]